MPKKKVSSKKVATKKVVKQNKTVVTKLFLAAVLMLLSFVLFDLVDKRMREIKATSKVNLTPVQQIDQELKVVDSAVKGSSTVKIDDSGLNEKALGL